MWPFTTDRPGSTVHDTAQWLKGKFKWLEAVPQDPGGRNLAGANPIRPCSSHTRGNKYTPPESGVGPRHWVVSCLRWQRGQLSRMEGGHCVLQGARDQVRVPPKAASLLGFYCQGRLPTVSPQPTSRALAPALHPHLAASLPPRSAGLLSSLPPPPTPRHQVRGQGFSPVSWAFHTESTHNACLLTEWDEFPVREVFPADPG